VPSQGLVQTARGDSLVPLPTDTLIARRITYRFYIPATVDTFEYPVIKGQARIDTVHTLLPIFLTIRLRTYRWCLIDGQRTRVFDRAYACPLSLSSK
jgi:hypothetical protein